MATPIGTNVVTSLSRRHIMPTIVDAIYNDNPVFFRLIAANKRIIGGGTQIEQPWMFKRFTSGGPYRGFDLITPTPEDTIKNGAWDWRQYAVTVAVDGLTLIKVDSPEAIANFLVAYFEQAKMEMCENLATGLWSDGTTNTKHIDGIKGTVDDGTVLATYAGITRSSNTWLNSQVDSTTATLTLNALNSHFGNCRRGGRSPSLIASRQEQYNRYWNVNQVVQTFPIQPGGHDVQLASAGFDNMLFNGVPWVVDSHVFDGPNSSNSAIVMLNEDYLKIAVSPRADFYMQDFQVPVEQDAMVAKILWAGNLLCMNPARNGKMTNVSA